MAPGQRHATWPVLRHLWGVAGLALLVVLWSATSATLGGWTSAVVANDTNAASLGSLAFAHSGGGTACQLGPRVTATLACSGAPVPLTSAAGAAATRTTDLTHSGTMPADRLTQSVSAASCATVSLSNVKRATNPLLPRYSVDVRSGDPWGGTNAVAVTGAGTAYAVAAQTYTKASVDGASYGLGVWFKAAPGQSGPLFSTATSAVNVAGADDRILQLNANGTLTFIQNTTTGSPAPAASRTTTVGTFADNLWHFAYVLMTDEGSTTNTRLSVDTGAAVTNGSVATVYSTGNGYVHAGWAPTIRTGLASAYVTGSLSNLVVFNTSPAPVKPTAAQLASQAAFTTWAGTAFDHWLLGDSGTTTFTGTQPTITTTSPCALLDIAWDVTGPTASLTAATQLSGFANGTVRTVPGVPGPGTAQTSIVTISRRSANTVAQNTYLSGLRLYVPITVRVQNLDGSWPLTFTFSTKDAVVIA
ncbi:MAG: hypothetical protein LH468_08195 [Nocardioides sp.]|nr:hypothetical protein [Nocardioides sp.]